MGISDHLTCLLRSLYAGQEGTVRSGHGTTDQFQVRKGVHQGYMLTPCLFNFYAEYIMRNAGLDESQGGIKTVRRKINSLRYADDTTLMAVGVPRIGYWASCGSSLVCYFVIMCLSYFIGQHKAPIPYDLKSIGGYTALTIGLLAVYYAIRLYYIHNMWALMAVGTVLIGLYLLILTRKDFPIQDVLRNRRNHGSGRSNWDRAN